MAGTSTNPNETAASPVEREIKLLDPRALDAESVFRMLEALGARVEPLAPITQTDAYLDSARHDLARVGAALRIRRVAEAEGRTATFKGPGIIEEALHTRLEVEAPWDGAAPPSTAAELPDSLRHHVEPRTWNRSLELLATIATRRHRARVAFGDGALAELAVDRVEGTVRGTAAPAFAEIELEALEGESPAFAGLSRRLVGEHGFEPSGVSKLERVLAELEALPARGPRERLEPAMAFRDAALVVFARQLRRLQDEEPGTRLETHIERLHKMRVATRRLRAAFRMFGGAFGERELAPSLRILRRTGRVLGPARDLDVLLETLDELAPTLPADVAEDLEPLGRMIRTMRAREQKRVLGWLTARQRLAGFERFERFCERRGERGRVSLRLDEIAPGLILHAARRTLGKGARIGADSPAERLHRLRIALKRLRYTLEFFAEVYGKPLRQVIERARELQDVLGTFNDVQVQSAFLRELVERRARRLPRRTVLAAGALLGALAVRGEQARAHFDEAWRVFHSEKTRRALERALTAQL